MITAYDPIVVRAIGRFPDKNKIHDRSSHRLSRIGSRHGAVTRSPNIQNAKAFLFHQGSSFSNCAARVPNSDPRREQRCGCGASSSFHNHPSPSPAFFSSYVCEPFSVCLINRTRGASSSDSEPHFLTVDHYATLLPNVGVRRT